VWTNNQRKALIESIKKGMPIGALLMYKVGEKEGITEYQLIDGLQRVTTLKRYYDKPTDFYDEFNLSDRLIKDIVDFLVGILKINKKEDFILEDQIRKWIIEWIRSINGFEEADGFSSYEAAIYLDNKIKEIYNLELTKEDIKLLTDKLKPYLREIKEESDISDFKIPVIIYTGDQSNLPVIFERINSKGTQLNKYQIFAATWTTYDPIEIKNIEIIEKIKAKYEALIEEGLDVENYNPLNFNTSKFTYFEYLFGLGKLMVEKFPLLFKSKKAEHEADSIGFNIVAIALGHDLKNLSNLPETLKKVDIGDMEEKILDTIREVNDMLKPFIQLKANKKNGNAFPVVHSEFQIISIVGKVFRSKYIIDKVSDAHWKIVYNNQWEEIKESLVRNIPFHYLYDIIKGYWSGTGDKKAIERANSDKYEKPITRDMWDILLNEWHESEKNKKEKSREKINPVSVLFLKYIYTHILTAHEEHSGNEFEIDHVVPVALLKPIAQKVDGLPISAIGNLALIRKDINREKRNKTFYEYFDNLHMQGKITEAQKEEEIKKMEMFTFVNRDMINFVHKLNENTIDLYYEYLDKRFNIMKKKFYELNNID